MTDQNGKTIAMIGLGSMGSTIARLYIKQGHDVIVYNRSIAKTQALTNEGASAAQDIASAINSSKFIFICVLDYAASREIFSSLPNDADLSGKIFVQLTTGSPKEASDSERWFEQRGASYLDGAIQVAPEQMALPDTTILLSGKRNVFEEASTHLSVLGGNLTFLGEEISLANTMDLATLCYVYGAAIGFFQGALIAEAAGLDLRKYGKILQEISTNFGSFFKHEANMIAENNFEISQSPLSISILAVKRIEEATRDAGLDTRIPEFISRLFEEADAKGWGNKEAAIMIQLLRKNSS